MSRKSQNGVIADGEAEFQLGGDIAANLTRDAARDAARDAGSLVGVRAAHIPPWRVKSCASQPAQRLVRMQPPAEVFPPSKIRRPLDPRLGTLKAQACDVVETVLDVESADDGSGLIRREKCSPSRFTLS
jgi:hypothetical protein